MAEVKFTARDEQFIAACQRMNGAVGALAAKINIQLANSFKESEKITKRWEEGIGKLSDKLQGFGQAMSTYVTLPLAAFAAKAVQSYSEMDSLRRGLDTVMGSSGAAARELEKLKEVAKLPGLGFKEAIQGSTNLQAAGFSADLARRALLGFGNALATVGKGKAELDGVIVALTQISAKGKVSAEEINQIAERVPQIRKLMEGAFGTSNTEALQKMGISSQVFIEKITTELEKLPRVAGGIGNAFENLSDSAFVSMSRIGEAINKNFDIEGKMNALAGVIDSLSQAFSKLDPDAQKAILSFGGIAVAIGPLSIAIGGLIRALPLLAAGFRSLMGPIGLLSTAAILLASNWDLVKRKFMEVQLAFYQKVGEGYSKALVKDADSMRMAAEYLRKAAAIRRELDGMRVGPEVVGDQGAAEDIRDKVAKPRTTNPLGGTTESELNKTQTSISKLNSVLERQQNNLEKLKTAAEEYSKAIRNLRNVMGGVDNLETVKTSGFEKLKGLTAKNPSAEIGNYLRGLKSAFDAPLVELRKSVNDALANTAQDALMGMADVVGAMIAGTAGVKDLGRMLGSSIGSILQQIGKAFISFGIAKAGLDKLIAIPGVGAAAAIAGGALIVALGSTLKSITQPKAFAKGGLVGGPTLGVFGEYIGASTNKEVVSPLNNLLGMIQGVVEPAMLRVASFGGNNSGSVKQTSVIRGADLHLVGIRTDRINTALRG